jgi:hypothetical protein
LLAAIYATADGPMDAAASQAATANAEATEKAADSEPLKWGARVKQNTHGEYFVESPTGNHYLVMSTTTGNACWTPFGGFTRWKHAENAMEALRLSPRPPDALADWGTTKPQTNSTAERSLAELAATVEQAMREIRTRCGYTDDGTTTNVRVAAMAPSCCIGEFSWSVGDATMAGTLDRAIEQAQKAEADKQRREFIARAEQRAAREALRSWNAARGGAA